MISDGLLFIIQNILGVLLLPLEAVNIGIDIITSIPVLSKFISIVAFVLPWSNLLPLFLIIISTFIFRGVIALIKTIWDVLPLV